jgi:N,N'-diacetyllegionaminate synthase
MNKVFIIAEAGVNHNGSQSLAKKMVDAAAACGADAIKFQTFDPSSLASRYAPKASYQLKTTPADKNQLQMLSELSLSLKAHRQLHDYCRRKKIIYLSSAFDLKSVDFLAGLNLKFLKVPSGEITNLPYLRKIAKLKKDVLLSTGMSTLSEVKAAVRTLCSCGLPRNKIILLHCNTEYPTPVNDANLSAMATMRKACRLLVGYSDHTAGIEVPIAAAALGAVVIEKHFTLDKNMPGPDHKASLEPDELKTMVSAIRNIQKAMGTGRKVPTSSEKKNIRIIRKSIVAARDIKKGERMNRSNLAVKRPGSGLSPMRWDSVIGRTAKCDFKKDQAIRL